MKTQASTTQSVMAAGIRRRATLPRVGHAVAAIVSAERQYRARRRLESLDDHILRDIGLRRDDVTTSTDRVIRPLD